MVNYSLLQISTRQYLYLLSQKYSRPITKIIDIPESVFDEWKQMGFEWVWMMGVWQIGQYGINFDRQDPYRRKKYDANCPGWTEEDVIGSPFAIVSYTINKELGEEKDIAWLRQQLNKRGMKLMLDFVPNHTSFDSEEIQQNKREYYIHFPDNMTIKDANMTEEDYQYRYGPNGIAYATTLDWKPWTDVAQLNYMNPDLRKTRIEILLKIASQCDGIRCDVSLSVRNDIFWNKWKFELEHCGYKKLEKEFWLEAISAVKEKYHNCVFFAEENYDATGILKKCGFDYVYDRNLFLQLEKTEDFDLSLVKKDINDPEIARYSHMVENHDQVRSLTAYNGNPQKEHAAAVITLTLPGLRFVNQDQWCGYKNHIEVQLRRTLKEEPNPEFLSFYTKLLEILRMDILKDGAFSVNDENCFNSQKDSSNILSWKYSKNNNYVSVFVNFTQSSINANYKFNNYNGNLDEVTDLFTNNKIKLNKSKELEIHLEPYHYLLVQY